MADNDEDTMTVRVAYWPADMSLIGKTVTWPREQAMQAIRDGRATIPVPPPYAPPADEPAPEPTEAAGDGEPHRRRRTTDK